MPRAVLFTAISRDEQFLAELTPAGRTLAVHSLVQFPPQEPEEVPGVAEPPPLQLINKGW